MGSNCSVGKKRGGRGQKRTWMEGWDQPRAFVCTACDLWPHFSLFCASFVPWLLPFPYVRAEPRLSCPAELSRSILAPLYSNHLFCFITHVLPVAVSREALVAFANWQRPTFSANGTDPIRAVGTRGLSAR